jgi:hypothetical protein
LSGTSLTAAAGPRRRVAATLILASVGAFVTSLDVVVVSTALPSLRAHLGASLSDLEWTINAYNLAFSASGAASPVSGSPPHSCSAGRSSRASTGSGSSGSTSPWAWWPRRRGVPAGGEPGAAAEARPRRPAADHPRAAVPRVGSGQGALGRLGQRGGDRRAGRRRGADRCVRRLGAPGRAADDADDLRAPGRHELGPDRHPAGADRRPAADGRRLPLARTDRPGRRRLSRAHPSVRGGRHRHLVLVAAIVALAGVVPALFGASRAEALAGGAEASPALAKR